MATAEEYENMSASEKKKEDWMNTKWRPMMGWMYMAVCICDFILFPVLHAIYVAALFKNGVPPSGIPEQWNPLTLQGAGLFHLAMGAVLGIAAYGRTQEKMNSSNAVSYMPQQSSYSIQPTVYQPAQYEPRATPVAMSTKGRPMPMQQDQQEI